MSDQPLTIGDVLFPESRKTALDGDHPAVSDLQETIGKEIRPVDRAVLNGVLLNKLAEMLDDPFVRVLAGAWSKYAEIRKYGDRKNYPSEDTVLVALAEHTISSEHRPSIQVLINGVVRFTLDFVVTLAIEVKAFELEIRDARIRKVRTGSFVGSGEVALKGAVLYRKELEKVALPVVFDLGEGLEIAT